MKFKYEKTLPLGPLSPSGPGYPGVPGKPLSPVGPGIPGLPGMPSLVSPGTPLRIHFTNDYCLFNACLKFAFVLLRKREILFL